MGYTFLSISFFCQLYPFLIAALLPTIHGSGFSYNYFDEMAQTYCASRFIPGWVFALRRDCATAPTCNDICTNAKEDILGTIGGQREQ